MSDALAARVAVAALSLALLLPGTARTQQAQNALDDRASAADLRATLADAETGVAVLKARIDSLRSDRDAQYTGSFEAGGRLVRFIPGQLNDADRQAIAEGLDRAGASLRARFGDDLTMFLDTLVWTARSPDETNQRWFWLSTKRNTPNYFDPWNWDTSRPNAALVTEIALDQAGHNFILRVPRLATFTKQALSLNGDSVRYLHAARELAISWATAGRECAAGSTGACRAVLTLPGEDLGRSLYFSPVDYRAVVTTGEISLTADSALHAMRRRCLAGSDPDCATAYLALKRIPDPFSGGLRSTVVEHALELGGTQAIARLRAAATDAPALSILASVAGVSEDSLVRSWQRRVRVALDEDSPSPAKDTLAVAAWSLLVLFGVTRRRP